MMEFCHVLKSEILYKHKKEKATSMFQLQELWGGGGKKYIGIFINVAKIDGNKILP